MQLHQVIIAILAILAWSSFLVGQSYFSTASSSLFAQTLGVSDDGQRKQQDQHRKLRLANENDHSSRYTDPKSIVDVGVKYVVEGGEAQLAEMKNVEPTISHSRSRQEVDQDVVIDVLSIGSETRFEYLTGQVETWASHPSIRHFWGFTEKQDYDVNCPLMDARSLNAYISTCRRPMGMDGAVEDFRRHHYGTISGFRRKKAGWFCAQRRPGRALGWIQAKYRPGSGIRTPDILIIVDDDTSVDIEKVKRNILREKFRKQPYSSAGCTFHSMGFSFAFGGYGTFINKAALQNMTQPVFCNNESIQNDERMKRTCENLAQNRIGELGSFSEGDSVLDTFYKYSGQEYYCMHSDWSLGYMLSYYSGGWLDTVQSKNCIGDPCTARSVTCHTQNPRDMEAFVQVRSQG